MKDIPVDILDIIFDYGRVNVMNYEKVCVEWRRKTRKTNAYKLKILVEGGYRGVPYVNNIRDAETVIYHTERLFGKEKEQKGEIRKKMGKKKLDEETVYKIIRAMNFYGVKKIKIPEVYYKIKDIGKAKSWNDVFSVENWYNLCYVKCGFIKALVGRLPITKKTIIYWVHHNLPLDQIPNDMLNEDLIMYWLKSIKNQHTSGFDLYQRVPDDFKNSSNILYSCIDSKFYWDIIPVQLRQDINIFTKYYIEKYGNKKCDVLDIRQLLRDTRNSKDIKRFIMSNNIIFNFLDYKPDINEIKDNILIFGIQNIKFGSLNIELSNFCNSHKLQDKDKYILYSSIFSLFL